MMYAPPPTVPRVDLYEIAKGHAWRKLWVSIGLTVGGLVIGVLALAVGFIVFIAIAMIIAGIIAFFVALAALTDPTRELTNLGPTEVHRRQGMRAAEAEIAHPSASVLEVTPGRALMGPTWLVYYDKDVLLVTPRNDVVGLFVIQKKNTRALQVQMRAGNRVDIEIGGFREQLVAAFSHAMPHAAGAPQIRAPGAYYGR